MGTAQRQRREIKLFRFQARQFRQMATQGISRVTCASVASTVSWLSAETAPERSFGRAPRRGQSLLLLRRDSRCLLGVNPPKTDVVADGDQPNRQPNKQGRKQRPRPLPQFKGAQSHMAIEGGLTKCGYPGERGE